MYEYQNFHDKSQNFREAGVERYETEEIQERQKETGGTEDTLLRFRTG